MNKIPEFLYNTLLNQYGQDLTNEIIDGYSKKRKTTFRVNTLKESVQNVKDVLTKNNIEFEEVLWSREALILKRSDEDEIRKLDIYDIGKIYLQSLSSMLPVLFLSPKENENILDMAAAPGGKTSQIAALSQNKALITACEKNKIRADRLKYNLDKLGANRVNVLIQDARRLDSYFSFDKILLDAPCSGSGTININSGKVNFSEELLQRSIKTQFELLKKAVDILKVGGEIIYSTCSILSGENEENLFKILKTKKMEIVPLDDINFDNVKTLPVKLEGTICVLPDGYYEGFFIAKLRKVKE